jgi:hypothetical protein
MGVVHVLLAPRNPLCASHLLIPFHLVNPQLGLKADYRGTTAPIPRWLCPCNELRWSPPPQLLRSPRTEPLVVVHNLAIHLGINLGLEEHDILEFGSVNPGGGGGGGRVEEGGQGELASILYRKDEVRVQLSFRVLVGYVRF